MIDNIGVDIIENARFEDFVNNERKLERILSPDEMNCLSKIIDRSRQLEYIASRFSSKEALFKAGLRFDFNKVSILNDEYGKPYVKEDLGMKILISISHNKTTSIAMVVTSSDIKK